MLCVDCQTESKTKVCNDCLKQRKPCATRKCTSVINPSSEHAFCYDCTCATNGCMQPHTAKTKYCKECINAWDIVCHICEEQKTTIPFRTCESCDTKKRSKCQNCDNRVFFNFATHSFADFCINCKCRVRECNENGASTKSGYCKACMSCFCTFCKKTFAVKGSELCQNCTSKQTRKCAQENCTNFVKWDNFAKQFYLYCQTCACTNKRYCKNAKTSSNGLCATCEQCIAPNCTKGIKPDQTNTFCPTCVYQYDVLGKVKCIDADCTEYTLAPDSRCEKA